MGLGAYWLYRQQDLEARPKGIKLKWEVPQDTLPCPAKLVQSSGSPLPTDLASREVRLAVGSLVHQRSSRLLYTALCTVCSTSLPGNWYSQFYLHWQSTVPFPSPSRGGTQFKLPASRQGDPCHVPTHPLPLKRHALLPVSFVVIIDMWAGGSRADCALPRCQHLDPACDDCDGPQVFLSAHRDVVYPPQVMHPVVVHWLGSQDISRVVDIPQGPNQPHPVIRPGFVCRKCVHVLLFVAGRCWCMHLLRGCHLQCAAP